MKKRLVPALVLIAYSAILIKVMVFKDVPLIRVGQLMLNFGGANAGHSANFVPFRTILPYVLGHNGLIIAGINLIGNIALLVPIGFLASFIYRNMTWKRSLVLAAASGLVIETAQVALRVGIFDIDDVILNALGVMIGYWAFIILTRWARERNYKNIAITAIICIAVAAVSFYAIYPKDPVVLSNVEEIISQDSDLCGGTGGLGQIVRMSGGTITIERNDGASEVITLTDETEVKDSSGPISGSDLKIGDRVTVVVMDESKTATVVLVCTVDGTETQSEQ